MLHSTICNLPFWSGLLINGQIAMSTDLRFFQIQVIPQGAHCVFKNRHRAFGSGFSRTDVGRPFTPIVAVPRFQRGFLDDHPCRFCHPAGRGLAHRVALGRPEEARFGHTPLAPD